MIIYEITKKEGGEWTELHLDKAMFEVERELNTNRFYHSIADGGSPYRSKIGELVVFAVKYPDGRVWDSELGYSYYYDWENE